MEADIMSGFGILGSRIAKSNDQFHSDVFTFLK